MNGQISSEALDVLGVRIEGGGLNLGVLDSKVIVCDTGLGVCLLVFKESDAYRSIKHLYELDIDRIKSEDKTYLKSIASSIMTNNIGVWKNAGEAAKKYINVFQSLILSATLYNYIVEAHKAGTVTKIYDPSDVELEKTYAQLLHFLQNRYNLIACRLTETPVFARGRAEYSFGLGFSGYFDTLLGNDILYIKQSLFNRFFRLKERHLLKQANGKYSTGDYKRDILVMNMRAVTVRKEDGCIDVTVEEKAKIDEITLPRGTMEALEPGVGLVRRTYHDLSSYEKQVARSCSIVALNDAITHTKRINNTRDDKLVGINLTNLKAITGEGYTYEDEKRLIERTFITRPTTKARWLLK